MQHKKGWLTVHSEEMVVLLVVQDAPETKIRDQAVQSVESAVLIQPCDAGMVTPQRVDSIISSYVHTKLLALTAAHKASAAALVPGAPPVE